jgi:hypothetical protein
MKHTIQLLFVLIFLISQIVQAQNYSFEEVPGWVKTIDIPEESSISKYEIMSGYYLKLLDCQVNLEEDAFFNHEVRNVISYSGITEASQISIIFDTSYQHIKIHYLYIWRKGKKIDCTKDLTLEIMNNEYNLEQGIYTGQITLYDILNDIRKDDLIDFAYTTVGNNPIFENEKYLYIPLEALNPMDLYVVRVLYPKEKDYTYECVDCDSLGFSSEEIDGYRQIEIYNYNLPALKLEDYIPSWIIPYKYFTLSSLKSWKDVNIWAQNVFALQEEPDLEIVFDEIFTGEETTDQKINKIINYVQDDIRYMGIESGIGSIKPFHPEEVVKHRYGDCKDKSLLLVSLLKKIGVEKAYPALVNTVMKHELDKFFPSNEVFDHCIVTFEYNDSSYWVDPTYSMQGGDFKNLYNYDYGKALIIGLSADSLCKMSPSNTQGGTNYTDELTVTSFTEPAELKIISDRYGFEADNRRAALEYYSINDITENLESSLKKLYPIVNETAELEISDDIETNNFSATYSYEVDGFWKDGDKTDDASLKGYWIFVFEPLTIYDYLSESVCEEREFDFELNYPLNLNYRMIFHFPKDMLIYDASEIFDNDAFYYEEKVEQLNSNSFQVDYNFIIKAPSIKTDDYLDVCEQINTISKNLSLIIYFTK